MPQPFPSPQPRPLQRAVVLRALTGRRALRQLAPKARNDREFPEER